MYIGRNIESGVIEAGQRIVDVFLLQGQGRLVSQHCLKRYFRMLDM